MTCSCQRCHCAAAPRHHLAQIVPNFRVRTIPVLGTAPAVFGMAAAAYILCALAGSPLEGEPIIQLQGQQYDRALDRLRQREQEVFGAEHGDLPVDRDDVSEAACRAADACLLPGVRLLAGGADAAAHSACMLHCAP